MDHGIWATWYDLEPADKDKFISWLHGEYLPALQARPGFSWVAHYENQGGGPQMRQVGGIVARPDEDIGSGSQFLMLVGAPSPHTFLNPSVLQIEREAPQRARDMLALRRGARPAIFVEEMRVNGPAARERPPGTTPGPAIQMGSFRVRSVEEEFDLGCWYAQYRLPHMAQMPGSIASRKLLCVAGWAKHAVMYEFSSLEARLANFEEPHESHALDPKEWTGRVVRYTIHTPGSPTVGLRIWPPAV
ncbi:MAG TPA: hypothetical protein VHG27_02570 [Xanthobacteraceae bacterium]|nr:hypothetical protein [Xanthobacteraceae bacterium]